MKTKNYSIRKPALTKYTLIFGFSFAIVNLITITLFSSIFKPIYKQYLPYFQSNNMGTLEISILIFSLINILIGFIFYYFAWKLIIKPTLIISDATTEVSNGNFNVEIKKPISFKFIKSTANNFNTMVKELQSTEILQNDFISNISHEIRTPLSAINGYAELLKSKDIDDSEEKNRYVEKIIENSSLITKYTENILLVSKFQSQQIVMNKKEFRLDEQIRDAILSLEPEWSKKNIDYILDLKKINIYTNDSILYHVWKNLISNAIKFSQQNSKISISLNETETDIVAVIKDNGCGMDEKTLNQIFDKFYQDNTNEKSQGTGLGLALTKQIVALCEGTIKVESQPKHGSTFTVTLPKENKP